ncbi:MAG TPA: helix-turn-helix transcriptional regulator [Thermoanaerobaculia bacterium]
MDEESLRNTLKVQRAIRDLTQADLAVLAGATRRTINAIEAGRMVPSVVLALKIARALGVAVETVFTLDARDEPVVSEGRTL